MYIIQNKTQLDQIDTSNFLAYPFIHHSGTVFKCYSCGYQSMMRKSALTNQVEFNSRKELPNELKGQTEKLVNDPIQQ
jgi:hypothetical protein